jgi:hypothetical protein
MPGKFDDVELPSFWWHWRSWEEIKASSWFTKINWVNIVMLAGFVGLAIYQARSKIVSFPTNLITTSSPLHPLTPTKKAAEKAGYEKRFLKAPNFPQPAEQSDFDHTQTEPLQLRPFKPKYYLTMGTPSPYPQPRTNFPKTPTPQPSRPSNQTTSSSWTRTTFPACNTAKPL